MESVVHDHQQGYYDAINRSNAAGAGTVFIEFMLSVIAASLNEAVNMSDAMSDASQDKSTVRWRRIADFLLCHDHVQNADVRQLCGVSAATANRILVGFVRAGKLVRRRRDGIWVYQRME